MAKPAATGTETKATETKESKDARDQQMNVKFTEAEGIAFKSRAKQAGKTPMNYARSLLGLPELNAGSTFWGA